MSKCVICCLDININFKVSTESTRGDENDPQTEFLLGSQNNRIVFQTFCSYFKISSREWEKLCDNFIFGAASKNNSSNSQKYGKRKKLQDTSEINEEIPVPFCDECLALVKNLSELDKMLQMIQSEVSKMFSDILTVILTRKNENKGNCKFTSDNPHSSNSTPHHDVDEIFGSEIIRLRNCIYEQYRPRLILSDYLKYKSPSQLTSADVEHLTKSTIKSKDVKSHSPLHQKPNRKRRSIRMRKTTSRFHPQNAVVNINEIVDLDQHQNQDEPSTTNKTNNNNNFTTENPTSPNFMETNDDDYLDEDPLNFNQEEEQQQAEDEVQIVEKNEDEKVKIKIGSPVKPLENSQFNPTVINYSSAYNNNNNFTAIKIEPSEPTSTATSNDCESPTKSRKAKNEALLKIKHKIEELSTLDINLNLNKNPNEFDFPVGQPQILDEIELDSDGEYVHNNDDDDDNFNGSEYESSCDDNENEEEKEDDDDDWRASFGYSTAPKRKRGRPPGAKNKNKKNKPQHKNSDLNMDSQIDEIKRRKGRPAGSRNKKTIELQQQRESTEETNPDNVDKNKIGLNEHPSLVFFVKQQTCEQYEKEDGTSFFRCGGCEFTTSWRRSLSYHVDVFHSERKLHCVYCRGGKYSPSTFGRHMYKHHGDKRKKNVVIPCGPNLFYYNNHVFEKTEAGFKCLHDECHQIFEEFVQEIPTTTTTTLTTINEIDESDINLNPDCSSSQNPKDNNNINNSNQDPAQIQVQTATENEAQESEQDKEQEEEMTLIKGTEFIIDHTNSVHLRKCNVDPSQRQKSSSGIICELCGLSFRIGSAFRHHVAIKHSEERPFVCETCGLSLKTVGRLRLHQQTHNTDQVFTCTSNGCGRTCTLKRYLTQHMSSGYHEEGKNYTCSICEEQGIVKTFTQRFSLKRHKRNHVIERARNKKCPECFKGFYTNSEVRQHLIRCPVLLGLQPKPLEEEEEEEEMNENETDRSNMESHLHSETTTSTCEINQPSPNLDLNVTH